MTGSFTSGPGSDTADGDVTDFELRNVGAGPDPFSLAALPDDVDFAILFFQRDHYCTNCRKQVQTLGDRIEAFHDRNAEVVSIVPEPVERVRKWGDRYDPPYPLLADPDATAGEAYDQPVRFGVLGRLSDFFGRMPAIVVIDRRGPEPEIASVYRGSSTFDRPDIPDILSHLDDRIENEPGDSTENRSSAPGSDGGM